MTRTEGVMASDSTRSEESKRGWYSWYVIESLLDLIDSGCGEAPPVDEAKRQRILADSEYPAGDILSGNVALQIYANRAGWPADKYVDDLRGAPGDLAAMIALSAIRGLWPRDNLRNDVLGAVGNQAVGIVRLAEEGLWTLNSLREDLIAASGMVDEAIARACAVGLWPKELMRTDILAGDYDAWAIFNARKAGTWPEETYVDDIRGARKRRAVAIVMSRKNALWPEESFRKDLEAAVGIDQAYALDMAQRLGLLDAYTSRSEIR